MTEKKLSKSQLLFSFIKDNLEKCKTSDGKKEVQKLFNEKYPKNKVSINHLSNVLHKVLDKSNISRVDFNLKPKNQTTSDSSELELNLESGEVPETRTATSQEIQDHLSENSTSLEDANNGKVKIKYTIAMVSSFWVGVWSLFQMFIPELDDLDDIEKNEIGEAFLPLFQKYLAYGFMEILTPLMVLGGIFGAKIKNARKIRQANRLKEKEQKRIAESNPDNLQLENKDTTEKSDPQ